MKCCHEKIHWTKRHTLLVYRSTVSTSTLCFDTNSFSTDWSLHQSEFSRQGSFRPAARGGEMCQDTVTFVKRCKFSIKHTILSEWFLIVKALVRRFQQGKGPSRAFSRHCESSRSSVDSSTGHQVTFAKLCPVYDVCPGIPCLDTLYIPGPRSRSSRPSYKLRRKTAEVTWLQENGTETGEAVW